MTGNVCCSRTTLEFFSAEELRRRFEQDGLKAAALGEQLVTMAARKEPTVTVGSCTFPAL